MSFTGRNKTFDETVVANNGFYPDIALGDVQTIFRVPTTLATQTVTHELTVALFDINKALMAKQQEWLAAGFNTLAQVDEYDQGFRSTLYLEAVACRTKAFLLRDYQTFSRRDVAENLAVDGNDTTEFLWTKSDAALRALLGVPAIGVDLL